MKKDIIAHFIIIAVIFLLITIYRNWFNLSYWPFWIGGVLGLVLPYSDYYIFDRFLKDPQMVMGEQKLIFHTVLFQVILLILTFWVITSSSSLFGRGIVLSASFSLVISQLQIVMRGQSLAQWTKNLSISLSQQQERVYVLAVFALLLVFGFIF